MLLKTGGIAAAVLIVLALGVVAGIYFGFLPNPLLKAPEHSARYYPQDTLAYAWVTLYPGGGQRGQLRDLWERFNESRAFRNWLDDLYDAFEEETGADLEQDVLPWIGPDFSVGVIELTDDDAILAATIGVRDRDAAAIFVDQWLDYLEDTEGADFDADTYRGVATWADDNFGQAYALTEDLLVAVIAAEEAEDVLAEMLDLVSGSGAPALSAAADFQAARAALPQRRFASVYVNSRATLDSVADYSTAFADWPAFDGWGKAPDWVAGSANWVERGIVLETVAPNAEGYGQNLSPLSDPARLLPDTTLGFAAVSFDPDLDNWRAELAQYTLSDWMGGDAVAASEVLYLSALALGADLGNIPEPEDTGADLLDFALEMVEDRIGIDLETDLFDHLGGAAIVAVDDVDFERVARNPAENPVAAAALLSYRAAGEQALAATMQQAADLLEDQAGLDADPANVGAANQAQVFDLGAAGGKYAPGYVLNDGYLTLGTTKDALKNIVAVQQGYADSLASVAEYNRAVGYLPYKGHFLAWVNLNRIIIAQLDNDDQGIPRDRQRLLRESVGTLAAGVNAEVDYIRASLVLTLFPE